jgi:hypothetical protein
MQLGTLLAIAFRYSNFVHNWLNPNTSNNNLDVMFLDASSFVSCKPSQGLLCFVDASMG